MERKARGKTRIEDFISFEKTGERNGAGEGEKGRGAQEKRALANSYQ